MTVTVKLRQCLFRGSFNNGLLTAQESMNWRQTNSHFKGFKKVKQFCFAGTYVVL
jgi:hypothetical protein